MINAKQIHAIVQAAQSVCQTIGGTDEKATRIAHNLAIGELQKALSALTAEYPMPHVLVPLEVSDDFLRNVLATACEGGSNYWAFFKSLKSFPGQYGREWQQVRVTDSEGYAEQKDYVIDLPELREGLRRMISRDFTSKESHAIPYAQSAGEVLIAVLENDAGQIDANLADLILQCACFGHIVYG